MRFRAIVAVVLSCALALGAGTAAIAGGDTAKTKVKITEGNAAHFEGKVTSKASKCEKGRKVSLHYSYGGPYKGDVLDTVKTDSQGNWEIDGEFAAGLYYASASEKEKGGLLCKAGKSAKKQY